MASGRGGGFGGLSFRSFGGLRGSRCKAGRFNDSADAASFRGWGGAREGGGRWGLRCRGFVCSRRPEAAKLDKKLY